MRCCRKPCRISGKTLVLKNDALSSSNVGLPGCNSSRDGTRLPRRPMSTVSSRWTERHIIIPMALLQSDSDGAKGLDLLDFTKRCFFCADGRTDLALRRCAVTSGLATSLETVGLMSTCCWRTLRWLIIMPWMRRYTFALPDANRHQFWCRGIRGWNSLIVESQIARSLHSSSRL